MRIILSALLIIFCFGCAQKVIPLKGTYSNGNFEATVDKPKDIIWDNIIDFFSKNGIPISLIDKNSGLIVSNEVALRWTRESKEGKPNNPKADIIIQSIYDPGSRTYLKPYLITGQWNIRIKSNVEGKTMVNVNLVNPKYTTIEGKMPTVFRQGTMQSLGNFEQTIFSNIN